MRVGRRRGPTRTQAWRYRPFAAAILFVVTGAAFFGASVPLRAHDGVIPDDPIARLRDYVQSLAIGSTIMIRILLSVVTISLLTISIAQAAGDPAAGKAKAAACAACHGTNGQGVPPNPALVGRSEDDMLQAMKDYKSGKRANAVMKGMTAGLSDQDMANLAAYYASMKK
jgi:cytochrome c553